MAPSITQLSKYFSTLDFGPSMELDIATELPLAQTVETVQKFPWNGLSCLSVVTYVLQFCSDTDNGDVLDIIKRLDDLAADYHPKPLDPDVMAKIRENGATYEEMRALRNYDPRSPENLEIERETAEVFVISFMPKVEGFFTFPPPSGKKDLAGFMHFLLQILHSESDHIQDEESAGQYIHQGSVRHIQVDLTFFLAVLVDTPFQFTEMEEIQYQLMELESLANETGSFIYSCLHSSYPVNFTLFSAGVTSLFDKIDFLKGQIALFIEFSDLPVPKLPDPRLTDAADALFIVHPLLEDLKNYSTHRVQLTDEIQEIKLQMPKLHKELISARSFLVHVPQRNDIEEQKICVIQIRDIAYEAEYLINSFVAKSLHPWYLAFRLPAVVRQLERIMEGCDEIRKIIDTEVLNVEDQVSSEVVVLNPIAANDDTIVGFKDETIMILDELTGGSDKNLHIIIIFGMPGLGKTTFARKLYDDRQLSITLMNVYGVLFHKHIKKEKH